MNPARLSVFRTVLVNAMEEIHRKDPTFYSWPASATAESIGAKLTASVEERGSIRAIDLTDRSRRKIVRALGIKNTLAAMDEYLKGA